MAFGVKQLLVAIPQPGTSNQPVATTKKKKGLAGLFGGSTTLPPFVPVAINVVDNYGIAITTVGTLTAEAIAAAALKITGAPGIPGTLSTIEAQLANVNTTLSRIADNKKTLADMLINLNIAVAAMVVAKNTETANLKVTAVNAVKSNNLYVAASTVQPVMPPLEEQIKEALDDAKSFITASSLLGFINTTMNSITFGITTYIVGTEVYKTVSAKIEEYKNALFNIISPPSLASVKSSAASLIGAKDIP
jgi:hypothetical protein